jgi:hypothetical protein
MPVAVAADEVPETNVVNLMDALRRRSLGEAGREPLQKRPPAANRNKPAKPKARPRRTQPSAGRALPGVGPTAARCRRPNLVDKGQARRWRGLAFISWAPAGQAHPKGADRLFDVINALLAQILAREAAILRTWSRTLREMQMPPGRAKFSSRAAMFTPSPKMPIEAADKGRTSASRPPPTQHSHVAGVGL